MGSFEFISALVLVVVLWGAYSLRNENIREYFSTKTGKGILKGIVLAIAFACVMALVGCGGTYFNDGYVYAGIDQTKKQSPQCENGVDDKATSNIGIRANVYQSQDKDFKANAKYTHHSCAFSPDAEQYDALGVELEYRLW